MAIITCPECKGKMSETLSRCPHCGYDLEATRSFYPGEPHEPQSPKTTPTRITRGWVTLITILCVVLAILLIVLLQRWLSPSGATPSSPATEYTSDTPGTIGRDSFHFSGSLGGDGSAWLELNGNGGRYHFTNYERNVNLISYDEHSGKLRLEATDYSGNHIGTFSGHVTRSGNRFTYSGTFTNYKGNEINFSFQTH